MFSTYSSLGLPMNTLRTLALSALGALAAAVATAQQTAIQLDFQIYRSSWSSYSSNGSLLWTPNEYFGIQATSYVPVTSFYDELTQTTQYIPTFDSVDLFKGNLLLSHAWWNSTENAPWVSVYPSAEFQSLASSAAAADALVGDYHIIATKGASATTIGFTVGSQTLPEFSGITMQGNPTDLRAGGTALTWTGGLENPDVWYAGIYNGAGQNLFGYLSPYYSTGNMTPTSFEVPLSFDRSGSMGFYVGSQRSFSQQLSDAITITSNPGELALSPMLNEAAYNGFSAEAPSVTPVPEPSTYGLLGAGSLAALVALRRRRGVHRTKV